MPALHEVIPRLEGLASTFTEANGNPAQKVADWVEAVKAALRSPSLRNRTDFDVVGTSIDLDESEEEIDTGAATLIGILGISKSEDEDVIISWYDVATGTNPTVASTDLNDGGQLGGSFYIEASSATVAAYQGVVFPGGQPLAAGLKIAATEKDEGTAIAADSCQAFVVWSSS